MIATELLVPADRDEASAAIASGRTDHFWLSGAGTFRNLPPPAEGATSISARRLDRIVEYDPADLTVTVEAGCSLQTLQQTLAQGGQFLPCDYPAAGTVGGLIATATTGHRALGYGSARERLLGLTVITPDGEMARSGSRVVKSVSGFDLPKLYCGSFGTLGFIVEATFKVSPLPARSEILWFSGARTDIAAFAARLLGSALRPTSLVASGKTFRSGATEPSHGRVAVGIEGSQARVRRLAAEIRSLSTRLSLAELDSEEADATTAQRYPDDYDVSLKVDQSAARELFARSAAPAGVIADLGTGRIFFETGNPLSDSELVSLESALQPGDMLTMKRGRQHFLRRRLDTAAADLSRRLKREFDPRDRLNRGLLESLL